MSRIREARSDEHLVADAGELGINVSRAREAGLDVEIRAERNRRWKEDNREANEAHVEYLERYGPLLQEYRPF